MAAKGGVGDVPDGLVFLPIKLKKMDLLNKMWGCKIILHDGKSTTAKRTLLYYNKGFRFAQFMKYDWYFRYRTALFQVQYKDKFVELRQFQYEHKETRDEEMKRANNIIIARKRKLTHGRNMLADYEKKWNSLFPISTDAYWNKLNNSIKSYEFELRNLISDFNEKFVA